MQLKLEELDSLKDGDMLSRKINELTVILEEKGFKIEYTHLMDYHAPQLTVQMFVSISA